MYIFVPFTLLFLLVLGMFLEFFRTSVKNSKAKLQRKISKVKHIVIKTQRLLNGQSLLPLTSVSAIVCLERADTALKTLADLERTRKYRERLLTIENKLKNFRALSEEEHYFYALLGIPTDLNEQGRMLKLALLLQMTLKVEHGKGRLDTVQFDGETRQLDILVIRLKAEMYKSQALACIEKKNYLQVTSLFDKSVELLESISCDNELVMDSAVSTIENINTLKDGIVGVIEEKNHTFYDKFKTESNEQNDAPFEVDDMDVIFGKKRKY